MLFIVCFLVFLSSFNIPVGVIEQLSPCVFACSCSKVTKSLFMSNGLLLM